jgi:hypothetical protein
MSTLATTNIKNPSSGTNNIELETNGDVTATGDVTASNVSDSVSNVRTPRYTNHSGGNLTVSDEGVYWISGAATLTTLTIGTPTAGTIICVYNNKSSSITLACGSQVTSMRLGADNNTTHNATLTLGARSLTTITLVGNTVAIVTGTDVS